MTLECIGVMTDAFNREYYIFFPSSFIAGTFVAPRPGESGNGSLLTCGNIGDDRTLYCHTYNPSKLNMIF